jgi:antitoxin (DNA-binding transcriptional repressor) of toxin-antitoxin stability system
MEIINIADAKSRFSELISRTLAGERFVIRRREHIVAVLVNPTELERMERALHAARRLALALGQDEVLLTRIDRHDDVHPAMAAFGLWRNEPDLESLAEEITIERQQPSIRPGIDL